MFDTTQLVENPEKYDLSDSEDRDQLRREGDKAFLALFGVSSPTNAVYDSMYSRFVDWLLARDRHSQTYAPEDMAQILHDNGLVSDLEQGLEQLERLASERFPGNTVFFEGKVMTGFIEEDEIATTGYALVQIDTDDGPEYQLSFYQNLMPWG